MKPQREESCVDEEPSSLPDDEEDATMTESLPQLVGVERMSSRLSVPSEVIVHPIDDESLTGLKAEPRKWRKRNYFAFGTGILTVQFLLALALSRWGATVDRDDVVRNLKAHFEEGINKLNYTLLMSREQLGQSLMNRLSDANPLSYLTQEPSTRPGFKLAQQGASAHFPVVIVPGFVTSGLEIWSGRDCVQKQFRTRLWAAFNGARSLLVERDCWHNHMRLDPVTGSDPEGIRIRAAEGFTAADYFVQNYWVWGKIIENLADLGYTPSTMSLEAYDWRLAFPVLEQRDGYLTKLRLKIEAMHKTTGKKVVLTSHSMGSLLVHYFFAWVTTPERLGGGGGGRKWVDHHIHAYINIAGSHLGVPKAATALLSGEMSDTVVMGAIGSVVEQFFGRKMRRSLWSTWGSLWSMLPKGSDALWGTGADMCQRGRRSKNDPFCPPGEEELSPLIAMTDSLPQDDELDEAVEDASRPRSRSPSSRWPSGSHGHLLTSDTLSFLLSTGAGQGPDAASVRQHSLHGQEQSSSRTWHDPTRTPLPWAPKMRIYCMYGTGLPTERAYYYRRAEDVDGKLADPQLIMDPLIQNDAQNVSYGIRYTDGDGSVPLLSLGYICADAWVRPETGLNPSHTLVHTIEYPDRPEFRVDDPMRHGPHSADHVDILGNVDMTEDLLRIVANFSPARKSHIFSDIRAIARDVNAHSRGGLASSTYTDWGLE